MIRKGDWMITIDLKDAYLSVPVCEEHHPYLRFAWKGSLYEFQCLPFGLSSALRVFRKLLKPVMSFLRQRGVRSLIYLDDMLVMAQSRTELENLIFLLQYLGFRINWGKSHLVPDQLAHYLGFILNSLTLIISLPGEKIEKIVASCQAARRKRRISVRELLRLIGMMTATSLAILPAPLCY